jgi:DNA-binding GntR family transcriptional regulator
VRSRETGPDSDERTAGRWFATQVRDAVLAGEYAPGQRLVEADLAATYGVSRGVVRSTLIDLAHEGLLERVANVGARVRRVTPDEAIALTEVRMVVEGLCAARAAVRVGDREIEQLEELGRRMSEAVRSGQVLAYSELNADLHASIRRIADQPIAAEVLDGLRARNVRLQYGLALRPGRAEQSLREHLRLIESICDRDPAGAEAAARHHGRRVIEALRGRSAGDDNA